jgi:hypothetical protein
MIQLFALAAAAAAAAVDEDVVDGVPLIRLFIPVATGKSEVASPDRLETSVPRPLNRLLKSIGFKMGPAKAGPCSFRETRQA